MPSLIMMKAIESLYFFIQENKLSLMSAIIASGECHFNFHN
jgi:hypothetical protein